MGTGAGMAAAFGAPVGGVLYALEETSSHLSGLLIWRTFTAALATTLVLAFLKVPSPPPAALGKPGTPCRFSQALVRDALAPAYLGDTHGSGWAAAKV